MTQKPRFVKNALIPLEKLSLSERSGWRNRSTKRVAELRNIFADGQFGQSVACGVQVLPVEDVNGASIIDDGISTVQALVELKAGHAEGKVVTDAQLVAIFEQGLHVTVVTYNDNEDMLARRGWNTGKHDEESNTVRWSSVYMKIMVARDAHATTGDWSKVQKELTTRFNFSLSTVRRWARCAQYMDAAVLAELGKDDFENLKGYAIWDNEYLMGSGVKTRSKLSLDFARKAFKVLLDDERLSNKEFMEKVCAPLKLVEVWDRLMRKRYGSVCSLSSAYARLMERLTAPDGLKLVTAIAAAGVPLHGTGPANPGVPDCFALVAEFDRCKAGGLPPPSRVRTAEELAAEDAQKRKEADERAAAEAEVKAAMEAKAKEEAQLEELESGWISMAPPEGTQDEAGVSAASETALQEDRSRLTFAETSAELVEAMRGPLERCTRAAVVIAAPTSGWGVIGNYMEIARDLGNLYKDGSGCPGGQTKMRVVILAGARFDVLAKIQEKGKEMWPTSLPVLTLIQRRSVQTWAVRACFAVTFVDKADGAEVPSTLTIPKTSPNGAVAEGMTLRCRCAQCPFRTGQAPAVGDDPGATLVSEIAADDRVHSELERMQQELAEAEEGDTTEAADEVGSSVSALPEGEAQFLVDLWPFAYSTAYWRCILDGLVSGSRTGVLGILSPSAHPGSWLSSRRLAQDVFVCARRFSSHARRHAMQLYSDLRRKDLEPERSQPPITEATPSLAGFIRVSAPLSEDVLEAYDVSPGSLWRDGLNLSKLFGEAFNSQASRLVATQLETHGLAISAVDAKSGRGLEAARLFRDGESLPASALFFDAEAMLKMWLEHPGHNAYCDRIVAIADVQKQGSPVTVFAVLIGAAQFVNSYCGIRRGPNAKLVFTPARGFNEGALELQIATRNGAGIAKGSPIVMDYGPHGVFACGASAGGVRIASALSALFEQQRVSLPGEAAEHDSQKTEEAAVLAEAKEADEAAERKRKADEDAQEEEAKKRKVEEEEAKKKKAEAEEARAAGVRGDADQNGTLIQKVASPSSELRLIEHESKLVLVTLENTNKKMAKNSVLAQWSHHVNLTSKTEQGLAWSVKPKDIVLVKECSSLMTVQKAMSQHYGTYQQIFGYQTFVAGSCPKELVPLNTSKQYRLDFAHASFNSCRAAITAAIEVARTAEQCQCVWILRADETKKWVRPCGIALVNNGQIILQPGKVFHL